jgi:hypothetical protein
MTGSASSQLRSAYVAETTAGTIPATPGFTTLADAALITATPEIIEQRTLPALGARSGQAVGGITVSGTMGGKLVYGNLDPILETLLQGAWATNVLKDGKTVKTVAIENTIPAGVGGTSTMMRYRGVQAVGGSLVLASREEIGYSLDLRGMGSDAATTTAIAGASYSDPTNVTPLASGVDVGTVVFNGYTLDCMARAEIQFAFEGREDQPKLASNDLCGIARGAFLPVITARIYVESNFLAIYNAARANHTAFSVTFPLGSVSGSKYTLEFPQCAFASGNLDFSGANAIQEVVINPQYDATTEDCVVKITRAVA